MVIAHNFKNMETSEPLKQLFNKKFDKVKKVLPFSVSVNVTFYIDGKTKCVSVNISGSNVDIHAKACDDNVYHAVDDVIRTITRKAKKIKTNNVKSGKTKINNRLTDGFEATEEVCIEDDFDIV